MTVRLVRNPWLNVPGEGELEVRQFEDFSDERLKGVCAYCGTAADSRDHVPSKALLRKPYPPNLPVIWACYNCNNELSADEEYLRLFLHCVLAGATDPKLHADEDVARGLRRHAALRDRIERSRSEQLTLLDGPLQNWSPEMGRINRVVLKNAAGHAYYEFGEPEEGEVRFVGAAPLQAMPEGLREVFAASGPDVAGWPEVGCRMMTRLVTGTDVVDGWIVVQEGVYRYRVDRWEGGTRVRSVLHEYLGTAVCCHAA